MSLLIATVIVFLLTVHYWYEVSGHEGEDPTENQVQVRIAGRHFMLQTTLFVSTVGLLALFMSRIVSHVLALLVQDLANIPAYRNNGRTCKASTSQS